MIKKLFFGSVKKGKLVFEFPAEVTLHLRTLEGNEVEVTIDKKRKKRSRRENNYYWAVPVAIVAEFTGFTSEEAHESLKWLFLKKKNEVGIETCRSTTELSTVEFEEYCSKIRQYFAETFQLDIPEPNEISWE